MSSTDLDVLIRDRAYALWEADGRPSGQEHRHWAEARRQIEHENLAAETIVVQHIISMQASFEEIEPETARMREALYRPEPFSVELFGSQCPSMERVVVIRADKFGIAPTPQLAAA